MLLTHHVSSFPNSISHSRLKLNHHHAHFYRSSVSIKQTVLPNKSPKFLNTNTNTAHPLNPIFGLKNPDSFHLPTNSTNESKEKNFWAAVTLIIGTAVGPGMLGLPAATIKSGSIPSTIAIIVSWVYVISSIILVAELSFAAMEEEKAAEVSFTSLATKSFGTRFGAFVAVVYACLSFSLIIACVSGIGSIMCQWFPSMGFVLAHALFPVAAGIVIGFLPFEFVDVANRSLCILMLLSITLLVVIGLSVAKTNVVASFGRSSWMLSSILPAIPVTVLTLGFHVITPFICNVAGDSVSDARKAILIGGVVPLIMVVSWNLMILGLAGNNIAAASLDPISLLLSVNPSALPAVQGFAFAALATSLIGYAVSFPKQLTDTLSLISWKPNSNMRKNSSLDMVSHENRKGRAGFVVYSGGSQRGYVGRIVFSELDGSVSKNDELISDGKFSGVSMMLVVLGAPVLIASFFPSSFARALDFAGVYANCFLFGILPPAMAYIQQSRKKLRSGILPGGVATLLLLLGIASFLGIWH